MNRPPRAGALRIRAETKSAPAGELHSLTTVDEFVPTHICVPSHAIPLGWAPTLNVPTVAPVKESSTTESEL